MTLTGPAVLDIVQHFTERWNEIKKHKVSFIFKVRRLVKIDGVFSTKWIREYKAVDTEVLTLTCLIYSRYDWLALPHHLETEPMEAAIRKALC
jgi:hypothetical protein